MKKKILLKTKNVKKSKKGNVKLKWVSNDLLIAKALEKKKKNVGSVGLSKKKLAIIQDILKVIKILENE